MERIVTVDNDTLSGTPVFAGTRVPVRTFLDYLEAGKTVDAFLSDFPTVTKEMTSLFLEQASAALVRKNA
jgi:uncharacterized protein (DUF433 family)